MGNPITLIKKGESLPFVFDRGGATIAGWVCTIKVAKYPDDTPAVDRVIVPTGEEWDGFLTPAETAALAATGLWRLLGVLTNASTGERESVPVRFNLAEAWA